LPLMIVTVMKTILMDNQYNAQVTYLYFFHPACRNEICASLIPRQVFKEYRFRFSSAIGCDGPILLLVGLRIGGSTPKMLKYHAKHLTRGDNKIYYIIVRRIIG
jgi:hypothetical protein